MVETDDLRTRPELAALHHIEQAEEHLARIEEAFPAIGDEMKARVEMATAHGQLAVAYQLASLRETIKAVDLEALGGIGLGGVTIGEPFFPPVGLQKPAKAWQFWRWFE